MNSQNGWPALSSGSNKLHVWIIPARTGAIRVTLRNGSAGFLLAHFLLWWAEVIEPLAGRIADDWGWAPPRPVRGGADLSNHASGTAADANALQHPLGVRGTLTVRELALIAARLLKYRGCLRHGAFYSRRVDAMHVEINRNLSTVEKRARQLVDSPRGRRLLEVNPGQLEVIRS